MIAHRLSTIRQCDRIVVLDHGRIIEDGTYAELLARRGFFAELVQRQRLGRPAGRARRRSLKHGVAGKNKTKGK